MHFVCPSRSEHRKTAVREPFIALKPSTNNDEDQVNYIGPYYSISSNFLRRLLISPYTMNAFFLLVWNATGFAIILPFGVTLLQLGMAPTKLNKESSIY